MVNKIQLGDKHYEIDQLSEEMKTNIESLQFISARIEELTNVQALLQRSKNSYVNALKKEMLSNKAGVFFGEDL